MKTPLRLLVLAAMILGAPGVHAQTPRSPNAALEQADRALLSRDWIAKQADNICGLREPSQLSNPAQVDWEACLEATQEMKRMRDQGIQPDSPEGIKLRTAAANRVTKACEAVRAANGHCSVWKEIRHKDGRAIDDISSLVKAQF